MRGRDWRAWLSDLLILLGVAALMGAAFFWVRNTLAAGQIENRTYLISSVDHAPPLPTLIPTPSPTKVPPSPTARPSSTPVLDEPEGDTGEPTGYVPEPSGQVAEIQDQDAITATLEAPTQDNPDPTGPVTDIQDQATSVTLEAPTPVLPPSSGRIVRLVIPRLGVDRTVITIGLVGNGRNTDWNTDKLFANRNRPDLVGHLKSSVNPGDGSNIVLVGHNYNNSGYNWTGVFHNLKALRPGDRIKVYTQNGGEHQYEVQKVKQVPWVTKKGSELEKHLGYIWPKPYEQLTLVTCGGVNLWTWSARVYVVALPVGD